jgi:hypothetical protein
MVFKRYTHYNTNLNKMQSFFNQVQSSLYSESRPRILLLIDATENDEKVLCSRLHSPWNWSLQFYPVADKKVYYSVSTANVSNITSVLKAHLRHTNFIVTEITSGIPTLE